MAGLDDDVANLEQVWRDRAVDNYKDILESCDDLLNRTATTALEPRVLAVLAGVIAEIEEVNDPVISNYLGDWGTRAYWETAVGRPLPAAGESG